MARFATAAIGPPGYEWPAASPAECRRALETPLRFVKGVGPKRAAQLESLGLRTVEDLLYHLPFRYEDRRVITRIAAAQVGAQGSFIGRIVAADKKYVPSRRRHILRAILRDETGSLALVWYHVRPYIVDELQRGPTLLVHGKVERGLGLEKRIVHPEFLPMDPEQVDEAGRIMPVYLRPSGLPLKTLQRWVLEALQAYGGYLASFLPEPVARRQRLMTLHRAMTQVHHPDQDADVGELNAFASPSHRAIIFDEFFYLQLGLGLRKARTRQAAGISFKSASDLTARMRALLPFRLTQAQERALEAVYNDMESPCPMQRLIQGDVGSGKTIVAWLATLKAIENGFQGVWLAPTELLAEQHHRGLAGFASELGVKSALLVGSLPPKEKQQTLKRVESGAAGFVVGTHALIQEGIRLPKMGLGVIDEQHRFGVVQRMALRHLTSAPGARGPQPDILLMSATPIPRSLALVLYGDLEVTSLDEMPPGRSPVATHVLAGRERMRAYEFVQQQVSQGHQAYVVYPLVEASAQLDLRDASGMAEELGRTVFKDFRVGLIHGRMDAEERESVMRGFLRGDVQVLVATTVIEVGIDVPNATVMVIEHAERFGLSQLHQLRGRVGRGRDPAACFLLHYVARGSDALRRLRVMEQEMDGFRIAEADLALRGPGEFLGTRQSGLADFRLANLMRDSRLLHEARKEALEWLQADPYLTQPQSRPLGAILQHRWGRRLELGDTG